MLEYALAGRVRGTVLFLHGEPAAFAYDVATGRTMLGDVTGYDPRHGKLSPGMVVHYMVLEAMFADGRYDVFDFGPGDEHFKSLLATRTQFCADIYYFRPTLRNRLLVGGQRSLFALNHAAGAALGRLHLREPLKIAMHATMKIGKRIARAGRGRHACDVPQASREPASAGQERSPV
jgi:CelD/BcsL family acetyltransferase involved in cellulose biosynthesis